MKKSWKERLYDFSVSCSVEKKKNIPLIWITVGFICFVCSIVSFLLFKCVILLRILLYSSFILPILGMELMVVLVAIKSYNKETFLCNKVRNLLFANNLFVGTMLIFCPCITYFPISIALFPVDATRVTATVIALFMLIFSIVFSNPNYKHIKKKIVYVETDVNKLKVWIKSLKQRMGL